MASKKKHFKALVPTQARALSAKEFLDLADVPLEIERFANITDPPTRCTYQLEEGYSRGEGLCGEADDL